MWHSKFGLQQPEGKHFFTWRQNKWGRVGLAVNWHQALQPKNFTSYFIRNKKCPPSVKQTLNPECQAQRSNCAQFRILAVNYRNKNFLTGLSDQSSNKIWMTYNNSNLDLIGPTTVGCNLSADLVHVNFMLRYKQSTNSAVFGVKAPKGIYLKSK